MYKRLTLSGRNDISACRIVFIDEVEIGEVVRQPNGLWRAYDSAMRDHGSTYTSDWNAAKQLALGLGL